MQSLVFQVDGFHELRTVSIKQAKVAFYTIMPKKVSVLRVALPTGRLTKHTLL